MNLRVELANSRWNESATSLTQYVEQLRHSPQKLVLPAIRHATNGYQQSSWTGHQCVYFDAIESIDQLIEYELSEKPQSKEAGQ